jgi:hypothetical protein
MNLKNVQTGTIFKAEHNSKSYQKETEKIRQKTRKTIKTSTKPRKNWKRKKNL